MRYTTPMLVALAALVCGCQSAPCDDWPAAGPRSSERIADLQAARGAREDATLYPHHFDGPALNALGRAKLDAMLESPGGARPLAVFLNLADSDSAAKPRRDSAEAHLRQRGLAAADFRIEAGPNPGTAKPAAPALRTMARTDSAAPTAVPSPGSDTRNAGK